MIVELNDLFAEKPDALQFLSLYGAYSDEVDNQVDEEKNEDRTQRISQLAAQVTNCNYWKQYSNILYLLSRTIENAYFDSVKWERSQEEWQRKTAKELASCGVMMIVAVIIIEFGEEVASNYSIKLREYYHNKHINDPV